MGTNARYAREAAEAYRSRLDALLDEHGVPPSDPRAAGERAAAATAAGMAWNDEVGPFLDTDGVRRMLGGPSRQAVADRVRNRRLLALRTADAGRAARLLYPLWQFGGATLSGLARVLDVVGYDPNDRTQGWQLAAWLCAPDPRLGDRPPRALLAAGEVESVVALAPDVRYELGSDEAAAARGAGRRSA